MAGHLEKQSTQTKRKRHSTDPGIPPIIRFLIKLMLLIVAGGILMLFVIGIFVSHSNDMYPALRDGDLCITWKLKEPVYGDIVVYQARGERHFGRVVGMPGDVIDIDDTGAYTLNGNLPNETVYYETRRDPDSMVEYPCTVEEGKLFVLNDLRENMGDSRRFGPISTSYTEGCVAILLRRRGW